MSLVLNNKGIALVTSLMFTLISLGIVMALLTIVSQGIRVSGANKAYKTATEAGYGAVDVITRDIFPAAMRGAFDSAYQIGLVDKINMLLPSSETCINDKLSLSTSLWTNCIGTPTTPVPNQSPDFTFNLKATNDPAGFNVYAKITDTRCGGTSVGQPCSNSDSSGIDYLDAGGGVSSSVGTVTPQHRPAYYRLEVQSERAVNPKEKAELSVLYAY